ncbi:zinc finger CCCH-type antiviral protein 1 isoform X1 [Zootoca vivipara]|uniref:zinc finger CCCH-type antiviral protein 1 isoform X1 n=1 Tax=Zootoca vivipara TaxID=8524 RepID=UPI00293B896A|nr:zinc finger CCCH-type antiviral protein 1 isoform X1 [Zootoca vivipara]
MSDAAVCSFITKILCSEGGGCLGFSELPSLSGLSDHQLEEILQGAGKETFLVVPRDSERQVLAVSPVRLCSRNSCGGCERLHICKNYTKGRCFRPACGRWACKYSHDVFSEANRKILKAHELSGLNENELRVLLLQNDHFLWPDVCNFYNKGDGNCAQQDNCTKLHICRYFLRGQCRFPKCKRSHNLLQPNALKLLLEEGVDDRVAWNIQTICEHKTAVLSRELGPRKSNFPNARPASSGEKLSAENPREARLEQSSNIRNLMDLNQGVKATPCTKPPQNSEKEKSDEICLFYVWRFCKNKTNCNMIHYDMPYRWQVQTANGWKDLPRREEIEKAYSDPSITSTSDPEYIDFSTMTTSMSRVRRLSTPSSVTKPPKFVMTTKWLWYWRNDLGQWTEYGTQGGQLQDSLGSDDLENLFLAVPEGSIQFKAGSQQYEISFKDMKQRNLQYQTQREVRRRPKFVSSEDVKTKKGHTNHAPASIPSTDYPNTWDKSALPAVGYKAVEVIKMTPEYTKIETLFQKTMSNYVIEKLKRIQNPSLWQIFQWQKEQMKKKNGGNTVDERLLFHGTSPSSLEAICSDNFDWRICGTNGTAYGKGSYFARDAAYSHNYCPHDAKVKTMFVAQVLVGDFVVGNSAYTRPPEKSSGTINCYDSCVNNLADPSIFVVFEKPQIYPAYLISYRDDRQSGYVSITRGMTPGRSNTRVQQTWVPSSAPAATYYVSPVSVSAATASAATSTPTYHARQVAANNNREEEKKCVIS